MLLYLNKSQKKKPVICNIENQDCIFVYFFKSVLIVVSNLSANKKAVFFRKFQFLFHEDSQDTGVWKYVGVWKYCAVGRKTRLYTNMPRIHLLSPFTIPSYRGFLLGSRPYVSSYHEDTHKCTLTIT